jgi:hypothetical protein
MEKQIKSLTRSSEKYKKRNHRLNLKINRIPEAMTPRSKADYYLKGP